MFNCTTYTMGTINRTPTGMMKAGMPGPLEQKERQVSDMQEDVLGTRRAAISETYVNCARCNKVTSLRYARIIQSDVLSDSHSEFEYLCPECQKALAEGEKDLPIL